MSDPHLQLADYRRRVAAMYHDARRADLAVEERLRRFRAAKDELFGTHPQSPILVSERPTFRGLPYWPHEPDLRVEAVFTPLETASGEAVPRSGGGEMALQRIGSVSIRLGGSNHTLGVYWFTDYAGGIFIPFRDATNGVETYGGGRYLWDSAKGADLGSTDDELILDFNYAYHPSCVYDPQWSCPLAPPDNRIGIPIRGGERLRRDAW